MLSVSLLTSYTCNVEYPLRTSPPSRWWPRPSSPPRVHRRGTCTGRWRSGPHPPGEASSSRTCPGPQTHTGAVWATSRWPGSCCPCSWSCFSQTPCTVISENYLRSRLSHLTKCWNRNLSTAWFDRGSLSSSFLTSRSLMCLSPITAICSKSVMCSWNGKLTIREIIGRKPPEVKAEADAWRRSPWPQWPQHSQRCPETRDWILDPRQTSRKWDPHAPWNYDDE